MTEQGDWVRIDDPIQKERGRRLGRFREELRRLAIGWKSLGIEPADTRYSGGYAVVELCGLTCPPRHLHLEYAFDRSRGPRLLGEWADEYCFDGSEDDVELVVRGTDLSPKQMAAIAARWIEDQLRTPVLRQEWISIPRSGEPTVQRRRWVGADAELIYDDALWPLRLVPPTRPPDRVITERPDRRAGSAGTASDTG